MFYEFLFELIRLYYKQTHTFLVTILSYGCASAFIETLIINLPTAALIKGEKARTV